MAESIETRRNNWMRVVLGLMNLKNGLQGWVDTKSEQQYKTFLINVNAKCKTQAYDQCQVNSKCQNGKTKVKPPFRPAHFCDEMYKEIQNNHVRNKPFWMNTDSTKWQDPQVGYWEVAKCYLSSPGYLNKTSSYQIDASGLLSICKNSMFIHQHIVNIQHFIEVQQIRNIVMHNAHCELDKHTTDAFLDKMIAVLEDPQELVHDTFAKHAANQIRNIKHNTVKVPAVNYEALNKLMLTNFEEKPCEVNELIDRLRKDLAGFIDDENKHELRHTICYDTGNDEREQTVQGDNAAVCNAEPDSDADAIHDVGLPQIWTLADIVLVLMTGYGHKWQKPKDFNDEKFLEMIDAPRFDWPCKTLEEYGLTRELEHTLLDKSGHGEREQNVKVQQREEHNKDSDKDDWGICLKNVDIEGIWELLKDEKVPTYDTFLKAVDKLSTQTDNLRDFCRFVSNNLKRNIPNAKIVYPAINPKNNCIAFVVLSTSPSDQKYIGGYPVKMKYAYGHCNEDFSIRNKETKEDLCFESREDEKNINSAVRSAHAAFSEWPNYSRTSFSFYKSSRFNEKDSIITLIEKGCIVLFVFLKHWKPVGWDFFPGHFGEYEIDVRQSMCVQKHTLQMPSNDAYTQDGTVQGRIRRQGVNDKTFALTAAHVALKEEEVTRRRTELEVYEGDRLKRFGLPVAMSTPGLQYVSVTKAALGGERHVDVALLELPKKLQLADIDWDWDDLGFTRAPSLLNGFQLWAPSFNDIVIKYGMTTGVTIGKVRGIDSSFETKETGFIEIQPWQPRKTQPGDFGTQASVPGTSRLPFSRYGDSGSLVFVVNKDIIKSPPRGGSNLNGRDLAVVGMVNMGQEGDDMFYATHIDATMAALGSEYRFDE